MSPDSIFSIDLSPKAGKIYTTINRNWKEDVFYFLLVDRFHDGQQRTPTNVAGKSKGYGSAEELSGVYGGTIKGVMQQLDYIKDLGCTAIWLSPLLENNPESYHGYSIRNFLNIDPRFGTKEDLIELIDAAHERELKVVLDCVLNHSGNNWSYRNEEALYEGGIEQRVKDWREETYPIPVELRNFFLYKKKGMIRNWDKYPETREGDFFSLKKFNHDETAAGLQLQEILFRVYAYWIRETNCDGFRIDAAKHIGELPVARFCHRIKEYATYLGKNDFFIFSEIPVGDEKLDAFLGPVYSRLEKKYYFGSDTFLDFPLHFLLSRFFKGRESFEKIFKRYASLERLYFKTSSPFPLVTFLDNHDQIEGVVKQRIGALLDEDHIIAAVGLLLMLPGVPCLYYGTEQGLEGQGNSDVFIRESMFEGKSGKLCLQNQNSSIYKEISRLLRLRKGIKALMYGELVKPEIIQEAFGKEEGEVVFFSRRLYMDEVFIGFNPVKNDSKTISVKVKRGERKKEKLEFVYGLQGEIRASEATDESDIFNVEIPAGKFIILK